MKRPHKTLKATQKPQKRQKTTDFPKPLPPKPARKVRLDQLGWKTVALPDRLEDFEGFYGLEEIEDVTVIKDEGTGLISFETTKTEEEVGREVEQARRREEMEDERLERAMFGEGGEGGESEGSEAEDGEEDEWKGFGDSEGGNDDVDGGAGIDEKTNGTEPKKNKEKKTGAEPNPKSKTKETKKKKEAPPAKDGEDEQAAVDDQELSEGETFGPGAFDILANQPNDEDDEVDVSAWNVLNLSEKVLDSLAKLKFSTPTAIQSSTIPEIMAGRDVIGKASTGSGKTLAFGIPIVEAFLATEPTPKDAGDKTPLALIISPTRELAHQITDHLKALCSKGGFDAPYIVSITGGLSVQKQRRQLEKADIIVGTPGRLWEVISSGQGLLEKFKQIRFLVVDEADRLLSEGHYQELGEILKILEPDNEADDSAKGAVPLQRQTLVFSATFQKGLQGKLVGKAKAGNNLLTSQQSMEYLLKKLQFRDEKPIFIDANPSSQMASRLKEGLVECAGPEKDLYLYSLLLLHPQARALVFTNSIAAVRRLTPFLTNLALPAHALHSNMPQKARLRSIERFKERKGAILVATDVAARGLDIPGVELVVHYHLPRAADTYVHRSGRTARAAETGSSVLICAPEEVAGVRRLVAKVHARAHTAPVSKNTAHFIRTLDLDRRIVARLKPRATLAKRLADTVIAKEKKHADDESLRQAAEDLGVEYDSDVLDAEAKGKRGRGSGRKKKEKEASAVTKGEMQAIRAELKALLAQRVNTGVSARYLTSGGIDVEALMRGEGNREFLGEVGGLGLDG